VCFFLFFFFFGVGFFFFIPELPISVCKFFLSSISSYLGTFFFILFCVDLAVVGVFWVGRHFAFLFEQG